MNLYNSYDMDVESAYIIRLRGHPNSEALAERCANSCTKVGMPHAFWDAFDGTVSPIAVPPQVSGDSFLRMLKVTNHFLSRTEVACALSHISLWSHCAQIDKPIVVLEHDAVMVAPFRVHPLYNSIIYLGCQEQMAGWNVLPTPPHGSDGPNFHFILRAHAYALDPAVARSLLTHCLKYGINESADKLVRADIFPIHQMGLFAYDDPQESTINHLHSDDMTDKRNDRMER